MNKCFCFIVVMFMGVAAYAQATVSLVVSGDGVTKQEAITIALRSAIEQAFGTFISANTAILNDEIVKEEVATVSSGNINSYEELSSFEVNGRWEVTLKASVSVDKLVSYIQGKGAETEFAGQSFAMQMKLRKLNKENEKQALLNLVEHLGLLTHNYSLFDYKILQHEPEYIDGEKYKVPIIVYAVENSNYEKAIELVLRTFKSLALSDEEQLSYTNNKYPMGQCNPLDFDYRYYKKFQMRSDQRFLDFINESIMSHIAFNERCFQVERIGSGEEFRFFWVPFEPFIKSEFYFHPAIPTEVLYNTSGFKVIPNLSLGEQHITAVDLGVSVKWGSMNLGSCHLIIEGDHFAWGETTTKSTYDWSTYTLCQGSSTTMTKYCTSSSYGTVDNKTTLEKADDVAAQKLGGNWRMPTDAEWKELRNRDNCTWTWTTENSVNGYRVTSKKTGNSIFLPAASLRSGYNLNYAGYDGCYWSSSLYTGRSNDALYVIFGPSSVYGSNSSRCSGHSVRPVCD